MFEPRTYRTLMENERFSSFSVMHRETDLWIGVDRASFHKDMEKWSLEKIREFRNSVEAYASRDSRFFTALEPYRNRIPKPPLVEKMFAFSKKAGVGPMASVAGVFAQELGRSMIGAFGVREIVVENGGDIFLRVESCMRVGVFAGRSPFSNRIGLLIDPAHTPMGICTSSGTVGHSLSFGKADAVMIICREAGLADAYATAFGNRIQKAEDIKSVLEEAGKKGDIEGIMIVMGDRLGVRGKFPVKTFPAVSGEAVSSAGVREC